MIAETEEAFTLRLELDKDEATLLGALANFPDWGAQSREVADFCERLYDAVSGALDGRYMSPERHGFTDHTSV